MPPTSKDLSARKAAEMRHKLDSLTREIDDWKARSAAGQPLEKHNTQIHRLAAQLGELAARVGERLSGPPSGAGLLGESRDLERLILDAHRLWEFFRSKLALRDVPRFREHLALADDLAWACYEPARRRARDEDLKEPPLVFYNGCSSPFVLARGTAYEAEAVEGEGIGSGAVRQLLQALPIPVVGVPWFQIEHLSDVLVIGHEVGHTVEDDLHLTGRLHALLDGALAEAGGVPDRQAAWRAWLGEIFADVYGTLACGPAFAGALADFLAGDPGEVTTERRQPRAWGHYPTATLRILLVARALKELGFGAESDELRDEWATVYPAHAMGAFEPDVPRVIGALLGGPYPELQAARLPDLTAFSREDHAQATEVAGLALARQAIGVGEPRILLAGARLAFARDPAAYAERGVHARIVKRAAEARRGGVRGPRGAAAAAAELLRLAATDRTAGARLYEVLRQATMSSAAAPKSAGAPDAQPVPNS
ncbi:hypothetical protein WME94_19955 [Sorangium sp. So ce429]